MSQCYINIAIAKTSRDVDVLAVRIKGNKNALTAVSLACLEIRSRNEEVINSTRNRIYSLKVFLIDVDTFTCF